MNCKNLLVILEKGIWTECGQLMAVSTKFFEYQLAKIEVSWDTDTSELQKLIAYSRKWNFDKNAKRIEDYKHKVNCAPVM